MQKFSNPARNPRAKEALYPYYAGYSPEFVSDAVDWIAEKIEDPVLLDPWNGAGTTTRVGAQRRIRTLGFDLNPVMVVVACADLISPADSPVLEPLAKKIADFAKSLRKPEDTRQLEVFFARSAASSIANIGFSAWYHLVDERSPGIGKKGIDDISPVPALMLVALFNVIRALLSPLSTSNPTWLRIPKSDHEKITCGFKEVSDAFLREIQRLAGVVACRSRIEDYTAESRVLLGDSRALPLAANTVDGVVSSPPYCTRLDYGRATIAELSLLEALGVANYHEARSTLIGASVTQWRAVDEPPPSWGRTCRDFLQAVYAHPSKASQNYYYKSHFAYFHSMQLSLQELGRVLRPRGRACLVVQDSYYKDIHNDLPRVIEEMVAPLKISKVGEFAFEKKKSLCRINSNSDPYRAKRKPLEVAILFEKED